MANNERADHLLRCAYGNVVKARERSELGWPNSLVHMLLNVAAAQRRKAVELLGSE